MRKGKRERQKKGERGGEERRRGGKGKRERCMRYIIHVHVNVT